MRKLDTIHFNQRITPENCYSVSEAGCWEWKFGTCRGYGRMNAKKWGHRLAHRWMYELKMGKMGEGLELDHLCKNKICINPDHLQPVSHQENIRRGRQRKFSEAQVWIMKKLAKRVFSNGRLAKIFDTSKVTIGRITSGKYYKLSFV